jgi:hypothetical protein
MNLDGFLPIAADLGDFIIPLVVMLFLAISAIGQVLAKMREAQQGGEKPRQGPKPRPATQPGAPVGRDPVQSEVDDFLRDAVRGQAEARPRQWPVETAVDVQPVELVPEDASVADHVRQRAAAAKLGTLSSTVDSRLSHSGDAMESRLHGVFDHGLGALGQTSGESAQSTQPEEAATPDDRIAPIPGAGAAGLAAMLAEPGSVRQAIVLSEILERPESRWK